MWHTFTTCHKTYTLKCNLRRHINSAHILCAKYEDFNFFSSGTFFQDITIIKPSPHFKKGDCYDIQKLT